MKAFLRSFIDNKGINVFWALFLGKVFAFLSTLFVVRFTPQAAFGEASFALAFLGILTPFLGFGITQGLFRFGCIAKNDATKQQLVDFALNAAWWLIPLFLIMYWLIGWFAITGELMLYCFIGTSFRAIGFYFFSIAKIKERIFFNNLRFANIEIGFQSLQFVLIVTLTYYFGIYGFVAAFSFAPWMFIFFIRPKLKKILLPDEFSAKSFWNYNLHGSFSYFVSDFIFYADIILIGFLLSENDVALYKVLFLLPSNLSFLAQIFIQTDSPLLAKHYNQPNYLASYFWNYLKLMIPIGLIILVVVYVFETDIIRWVFGAKYANTYGFFILTLGSVIALWLRAPLGNMLTCIGKNYWNTRISLFSMAILIAGLTLGIPKWGLGAAFWTMFAVLSSSSLIYLWVMVVYFNKSLDVE